MSTKRIEVGSRSLYDIEKVLKALGVPIIEKFTTPGACGYTTIVITTQEA